MDEQFNEVIDKQLYKTPKEQFGYAEEYNVIRHDDPEDNLLLNYSLSNNLDDIEIAILNRTGHIINLKKAHWKINSNLSICVKHLMNKHRVKYSMTTWQKEDDRQVIAINMRSDDIWFIIGYDEYEGSFYCWNEIEILHIINKFLINNDKDN